MKYLEEFRNPDLARRLLDEIRSDHAALAMMEVCGGQTHSIIRNGIDQLLPPEIELIHGPGCPVCVTPLDMIDKALAIAARPEVTFCSFGDMLRSRQRQGPAARQERGRRRAHRLFAARCDQVGAGNPHRQIVFFGIGFETTAPANAMAVHRRGSGLITFRCWFRTRVPPAISAIMESPGNRVQAFLAAGHVCSVMGYWEYSLCSTGLGCPSW